MTIPNTDWMFDLKKIQINKIRYEPMHKDWYYSYTTIPNLKSIQAELINVRTTKRPDNINNPHYFYVNGNSLCMECPTLMSYFDDIGVSDIFNRVMFTSNTEWETPTIPHIDSGSNHISTQFSYALNLPLIDCKDSYTVFYETTDPMLSVAKLNGKVTYSTANKEKIAEIKRVEYDRPFLINTTIIHKGEMKLPTRAIASIRFNKPITEESFKKMGIAFPLVQID